MANSLIDVDLRATQRLRFEYTLELECGLPVWLLLRLFFRTSRVSRLYLVPTIHSGLAPNAASLSNNAVEKFHMLGYIYSTS